MDSRLLSVCLYMCVCVCTCCLCWMTFGINRLPALAVMTADSTHRLWICFLRGAVHRLSLLEQCLYECLLPSNTVASNFLKLASIESANSWCSCTWIYDPTVLCTVLLPTWDWSLVLLFCSVVVKMTTSNNDQQHLLLWCVQRDIQKSAQICNTLNMLPVFKDLRVAVWPHNCCLIVDLEWSVNTSSNLRMTEWIRSKCLMCFVGYAGFVGSGSSTALQKIIRYSKNAAQCVVTLPRCSVWTLYKCSLNLQMFLWCVNERLFRE